MFGKMVTQRDGCTKGSAAHEVLNQRVRALAWVLDHPKVPGILLEQAAIDLLDCVG
jgi:hypothetical protein